MSVKLLVDLANEKFVALFRWDLDLDIDIQNHIFLLTIVLVTVAVEAFSIDCWDLSIVLVNQRIIFGIVLIVRVDFNLDVNGRQTVFVLDFVVS